ncbi:cation-translocating P-type ATPase [Neglecta sp. X4]|uniref:cation-translocating P-type ATPase n=1 Tax=unclassified Neglectibacter TaxID=2632164 RepID=UPI00136E0D4D|nr:MULTISPECIES: cation-translocating P-type ATPase [unclassified Neglectibacter]NBI17433.1 cation-translocating P-type ATPase [Neglectibacter sp. 59]NBJ73629.1 cation-translocating P-type ATPase [Neglectibacter sp. X4]NCE80553.1 cation-translocating P-type ATPase [Neglectibacter sp. X58]
MAQTDQTRGQRLHPDPAAGLSSQQVAGQIQRGLHNGDSGVKSKTEGQIIWENVFTFFNLLNFALAAAVILVGSPRSALFMGVILSNIVIGSFQGIRAKHTIDKLSLISSPKAAVLRDGRRQTIPVEQVVLDDILLLTAGNQICADAVVAAGECEVNESLITGESDPILKQPGEPLLSGSFVVSGQCSAQVEHVGAENYANKIAGDAKYIKKRNSEIMDSIDLIVKIIGFAILPIGGLLFWKQYFVLGDTFQGSVVSTCAAMVGMIPEGLVLLISLAFAVSVIKLSRHKTLVQDMYCIETLARVDTLCLDKTGTITEGSMQVDGLSPFEGRTEAEMKEALAALTGSLQDDNPTFLALKDYLPGQSAWYASGTVPFSSARKWSGAFFPGKGAYVMGAGEFILGEAFQQRFPQAEEYSKNGQRVLLLARSDSPFEDKSLPEGLEPMGLVLISDKIRREAPRTLRYFADQGVDLKVISGDNAVTVSQIAKRAGLENADRYCDATTLRSDEDIRRAVSEYAVFGRVTPQQKLAFVKALKEDGHTVAMTGDGVNDVLALKEADCSIAMASGSDAARTVSNLVLLDSNFASMPLVVQEGRRSINNLQRSSSLFLQKTIFSALIGVLFIFINYTYPFEPIQQTLISSLTIGVPSFILALEPNRDRLRGKFIFNVLKMCIPAALTMTANIVLLCALSGPLGLAPQEMSTLAVILTSLTGFIMLFKVCTPFNSLRGFLFGGLLAVFVVALLFLGQFFSLVSLTLPMLIALLPMLLFAIVLMLALLHFIDHVIANSQSPMYPFKKRRRARKRSA